MTDPVSVAEFRGLARAARLYEDGDFELGIEPNRIVLPDRVTYSDIEKIYNGQHSDMPNWEAQFYAALAVIAEDPSQLTQGHLNALANADKLAVLTVAMTTKLPELKPTEEGLLKRLGNTPLEAVKQMARQIGKSGIARDGSAGGPDL